MSLRCTDNVVYDAMMPQHNDMMADGEGWMYCDLLFIGRHRLRGSSVARVDSGAGRLAFACGCCCGSYPIWTLTSGL
eukprot:scaffold905_cov223-Alexandrium_tamarense.AAC.6